MSERWKKQLKIGLLWGGVMTTIMSIWAALTTEVYDSSFFLKIALSAIIHFSTGIFFIGYLSWKKSQQPGN